MRVWVDASTLIALARIDEVQLLQRLLTRVAVSEEVATEVLTGKESAALRAARGEWIEVVRVRGRRARGPSLGLGPGEASLLLSPPDDTVILDDRAVRLVARAEGRAVVGLLGVILRAAREGALSRDEARSLLHRVGPSGFHLSGALLSAAPAELETSSRLD